MSVGPTGSVPIVDGGADNSVSVPQSNEVLHIFVDSNDVDTLKAVTSTGVVRVFQSNAVDVILEALP